MNKKLGELVVGKTIESVMYLSHDMIIFNFDDGTRLRIHQPSQSGALYVNFLDDVAHEIDADDKEYEYESL